jgi:hypothetical protein
VFSTLQPRFHWLTVGEMLDDLEHIRSVFRRATGVQLIVTVAPLPLHATVTLADVRVANTESKSRIRAAVSEFVERYPDVHYFHSFEIVTTAERLSDFMLEDGRHVRREAVDYILQQFLATFAADDVPLPQVSTSWISPPAKKAARVERKGGAWRRRIGAGVRRLLGVARAGGEW